MSHDDRRRIYAASLGHPACLTPPPLNVFRPFHSPARLALCVFACLTLTLFAFAPRLWLMRTYLPGTFQWDRAHTYLLQCEDPFRRDIEPAMLWRVLPPLVCHYAGLKGKIPLALPFLGVVALTTYTAVLLRRREPAAHFVFGGTLLVTTTSAVLVPLHWFGMNDAWVWLGLLAVAFGRARWAVPLACLFCPWVDERFIIGFPLAWTVRTLDRDEPLFNASAVLALWLLPYAALRLWLSRNPAVDQATAGFLRTSLAGNFSIMPFVPLGWWMGLRAGWALVVSAIWFAPATRRLPVSVVLLATLVVSWLLAADISRSAAITLPLLLLGCFTLAKIFPLQTPRVLLLVGLASLVIPAAHLTYNKIDLISPLPLEVTRLLRSP